MDIVGEHHAKSTLSSSAEGELDMKSESCSHLNLPDFTLIKNLAPLAWSSREA